MKFSYPCIAGQKEDGSFRVYFPDLEMCEATGRDLEEALENAKEAERGCAGCPWYDIARWRRELQKRLPPDGGTP